MLFSPTLRIAGRTAVNVLSNIFGIDGEMYYPQEYESGRGGYDDEIVYNDTPDWKGKFLAPFVFNGSKPHYGGFFDELNGDEKAIYFDDLANVPINSLIVFKMAAGDELYRVFDLYSNNDEYGHIYTKVIVVPITKSDIHTQNSKELNREYMEEVYESEVNPDNSTDEFLNELMGKPKEDILEGAIGEEIVEPSLKKSSKISLDFDEDDLL